MSAGAVQVSEASFMPGITARSAGAPGAIAGNVVAVAISENGINPVNSVTVWTLKLYLVLGSSPVTVAVVAVVGV